LERQLHETYKKRRKGNANGMDEHMLPRIPWKYISAGKAQQQVLGEFGYWILWRVQALMWLIPQNRKEIDLLMLLK
jgi:hypothetical protein